MCREVNRYFKKWVVSSILLIIALIGTTSCTKKQTTNEPFFSSKRADKTEKHESVSQTPVSQFVDEALSLERHLLENSKDKGKLISVHILDFNGFSETVTNKERLQQFAQKNFIYPQQYKKVLRVFKKSSKDASDTITIITSYHENGQIHRYIECVNGRASGNFREWHDNGQEKIIAYVISGAADLDEKSIDTWTFDGPSIARSSQGKLLGIFSYKKGLLDGLSITYSPSGYIEWITEYSDGKKTGFERRQKDDGTIIEEISHKNGLRDGISRGYWPSGKLKYQEDFQSDLLKEGVYYDDSSSTAISEVINGNGIRTIFDDERLLSQYQIIEGKRQGFVKIYNDDGSLMREFSEIDGKKHGKDILYYSDDALRFSDLPQDREEPMPKLMIEWRQGSITGIVETWYPTGKIESRREMKQNERDGISMCWYPDGSVMLVEEYEKGILKKGRYHKRGDTSPYSSINKGKGTATLFDQDGHIVERVEYIDGKPVVKD